jgi:hypothetical protein
MDLVRESELNTGCNVSATIGDSAYGDGAFRKEFADAGRRLIAKAPALPEREGKFSEDDFTVDALLTEVRCPRGIETTHYTRGAKAPSGEHYRVFHFPRTSCQSCPLAGQCVKHPGKDYRVFSVHSREQLLRAAREEQETVRFKHDYRPRQVAEHRIARLVQLGMRQARYFGHAKTLFHTVFTSRLPSTTPSASKSRNWLMAKSTQATTRFNSTPPISRAACTSIVCKREVMILPKRNLPLSYVTRRQSNDQ